MIINIDSREKAIYKQCSLKIKNYTNIILNSVNLPLGDIIICNDKNEELIIIERKTVNDLASSIRDGRYNEQSYRLNNCEIHNHNIYYLIEGSINSYNSRVSVNQKNCIDKRALLSSMTSISYFKGFSLYKTDSIDESCEWILSMADKLHREKKEAYYNKKLEETSKINDNNDDNYIIVSKRCKKDNINQSNIGGIMLSQIPGVSSSTASIIMEKYKNIKTLIKGLENNPNILDETIISIKNNKERKINKTTCKNIYDYLII